MAVYAVGDAEYEIPDNVQGSQLNSVLSQIAAQHAPSMPKQENTQGERTAEPNLLTQASDTLRGLRDIPQAGAQMLMHALPESVIDKGNEIIGKANELPVIGPVTRAIGIVPETTQQYDQSIQQDEQAYQQRRQQAGETGLDGTRIAGNIAAMAPVAAAGGGPMLQGAAAGALQPVTNGGENFATDKAIQTGIGAGTGYVAPKFVNWLAGIVKPAINPAVAKLTDAGVDMTPGAMSGNRALEAKFTSTPILGKKIVEASKRSIESFNRAAYKEALAPIGAAAPDDVGHAGLQQVRKTLNSAYDDVLKNVKFLPDEQFNTELASLKDMASGLAPKEKARFLRELANVESKQSPIGGMTGETYKIVESKLLKEAKNFQSSTDPYQRELGDALMQMSETYKSGLARANPKYAARLTKINEGWANYARLRKAASSVGAEDGIFSPEQLLNAVKAEDKTVGKRAFSEGTALLQDLAESGKKVIGRAYPDSGTAGREAIWNPIAWAGGAALSPVYSASQRLAAPLLLNRPAGAQALSNVLLQSAPVAGRVASPAMAAMSNPLINGR